MRVLALALVFCVLGTCIEVQVDGVGDFFGSVQALVEDLRTSALVPDSARLVIGAEQILKSPTLQGISNETLSILGLLSDSRWQTQVHRDVQAFVRLASNLDHVMAANAELIEEMLITSSKLLKDINRVLSQEENSNITQWLIPVLKNTANITESLASHRTTQFMHRASERIEQLLMVLLVFFGFLLICMFLLATICIFYAVKLLTSDIIFFRDGYRPVP